MARSMKKRSRRTKRRRKSRKSKTRRRRRTGGFSWLAKPTPRLYDHEEELERAEALKNDRNFFTTIMKMKKQKANGAKKPKLKAIFNKVYRDTPFTYKDADNLGLFQDELKWREIEGTRFNKENRKNRGDLISAPGRNVYLGGKKKKRKRKRKKRRTKKR